MRNLATLCLLFAIHVTIAQKHDYQWLFGNCDACVGIDSFRGGVTLDFNHSPVEVIQHRRLAGFREYNTSYCDYQGQLLFYSNGADVFDSRDSIMENGDSLNYGYWWEFWIQQPSLRYEGLGGYQSILSLPSPGDSNRIYILHNTQRFFQPGGGVPGYLTDTSYYSLVNTQGNFGFGSVEKKNVNINQDTLATGYFSAVKHGNGRDWWVLHPHFTGSEYYTFLLTDTGIGLHSIQRIGSTRIYYGDIGSSCFSPDGERYFLVNSLDGIFSFDFDRCTGILSNPAVIPFPYPSFSDSVSLAGGIAISPNNRFLYVTTNKLVLQYDLWSFSISTSIDTVAIWDGVYDPYPPLAATFFLAQLGPDGKIYINSTNSTTSLHVINRPDEKGDSCLFDQRGVKLNTYNQFSLPNFPNYRLEAKAGSPCDSLNTMTGELRAEKEKIIKLFPNPASQYVTVDYGFTDWNKGGAELQITNALGQVVYEKELPMYSGYQKINVKGFTRGFYSVRLKRNSQVVAVAKFVKE